MIEVTLYAAISNRGKDGFWRPMTRNASFRELPRAGDLILLEGQTHGEEQLVKRIVHSVSGEIIVELETTVFEDDFEEALVDMQWHKDFGFKVKYHEEESLE